MILTLPITMNGINISSTHFSLLRFLISNLYSYILIHFVHFSDLKDKIIFSALDEAKELSKNQWYILFCVGLINEDFLFIKKTTDI